MQDFVRVIFNDSMHFASNLTTYYDCLVQHLQPRSYALQ